MCLSRDDAERERFLEQLGERVAAYDIRLYAWCLMLTHFHLYLETPRANLGRFMHSLQTAYTVYSNLRRRRHGPLVGRYKAKPLEGDSYHLGLSRYVHLNPVRTAAALKRPGDGQVAAVGRLSLEQLSSLCGKGETATMAGLRSDFGFLFRRVSGTATQVPWFRGRCAWRGGEVEDQSAFKTTALAIGGDPFVDWIREKLDRARSRFQVCGGYSSAATCRSRTC